MKVLLINPPETFMIRSEVPSAVKEEGGNLPPLGLLYLHAILTQAGIETHFKDCAVSQCTREQLDAWFQDIHPDVVGITATTHKLVDVLRIAAFAKRSLPDSHICIGGPHTAIFPRETLAFPEVDSIIVGEGEYSFLSLIRHLEDPKVSLVNGIYLKSDLKQIKQVSMSEPAQTLDELPFPERSLIDPNAYYDVMTGRNVATMISSRGCPYHCAFCSTPHEDCRMRSAENIINEITLCQQLKIGTLYFLDDTFNLSEERVLKICDQMLQKGISLSWSCRCRVDKISYKLLKMMKRAGCERIQYGVETASEEGLELLKKEIDLNQVKEVFRLTREAGINSVAYFMIGLPHEKTVEDCYKTLQFSRELDPDFVMYNVFTPYPGTELYEEAIARGILSRDMWREFALNPDPEFIPEVWSEHLSRAQLYRILDKAYRSFYGRPIVIFRSLKSLRNMNELKRKMKAGMKLLFNR